MADFVHSKVESKFFNFFKDKGDIKRGLEDGSLADGIDEFRKNITGPGSLKEVAEKLTNPFAVELFEKFTASKVIGALLKLPNREVLFKFENPDNPHYGSALGFRIAIDTLHYFAATGRETVFDSESEGEDSTDEFNDIIYYTSESDDDEPQKIVEAGLKDIFLDGSCDEQQK